MRPIDADALKEKKVYSHERHEKIVPVAEIDWSPTIDVIPVEWIIKWSNKRYRETQRDVSIVDVLEAWQKEQEAR